jgi:hypothetical protein
MPKMARVPRCLEETISDIESSAVTMAAARVATITTPSRGHLGAGDAVTGKASGSSAVLLPAGGVGVPTTVSLGLLPVEPIGVALAVVRCLTV